MDDLHYRDWSPDAIADLGFDRDGYERAHMLVRLLDGIFRHPFMGPRLALKGGAAIHLFRREIIRVPLDVDFNYVAARDRTTMVAERPRFFESLQQVVAELGLQRAAVVEGHINFVWRTPLWPIRRQDSCVIAGDSARQAAVEDDHEVAAAKLATVVARSASRDLFDGRELLQRGDLDQRKLRIGFLVYGVLQSMDWRQASVARIRTSPDEVMALLPLLRRDLRPAPGRLEAWMEQLVHDTRDGMARLLAFEAHEREFLERLYTAGVLAPELLTRDPELQAIIRRHPGLASKVRAIRRQRGLVSEGIVEEDSLRRFRMRAAWPEDPATAPRS